MTASSRTTYVLDTSVLLSDPNAVYRFAEHEVVIPLIVVSELEGKRHHPELGFAARKALNMLDEFRQEFGRLDESLPLGEEGGSLRVEINHVDSSGMPVAFDRGENDTRILAVARNLQAEGDAVIVVTKDIPMRVKASALGLRAEEYLAELAIDSGFTGLSEAALDEAEMKTLFDTGHLETEAVAGEIVNTGLVLSSPRGSGLGRVVGPNRIKLVRGDRDVFGVHGRSAEQRIAIDLLTDQDIGIVSLGGRAGTGKSALALMAGLQAVLEDRTQEKIMVFRPLYAVGGQNLGYLPGSEGEKMNPWAEAVFDTLGALVSKNVIDEVVHRGLLEVLPLTHIRGRSLHDAYVIVDEAQSLERNVLLTVLSRLGQNSRVVLTHDVAQRDNLRVSRHDGVAAVIEKLKGHQLFAHITLTRSERSAIAALVTSVLEEYDMH
ncbi:PhoH family protein [Nocardia zapadnayensis]|uniref:PhoH family protein n=1 Tax=Brevibacterium pityocampae TaxID=506594 RepID=A0ABP8JSE7_9MICO|nr:MULTISPECIES: PhoH family protein [Actinomycetes]MCK1803866.1 PhoH family protein [Brevibacterium sp. R8603A2]MCX0276121.1 PhoH family protein [Nocardia zapadnayensis]